MSSQTFASATLKLTPQEQLRIMKIKFASSEVSQSSPKIALIMVSSSVLALMGCQSSPTQFAPNSTLQAGSLISSVDYQKNTQRDQQAYQNLFSTESGINSDEEAKSRLLTAITNHLVTPHVAVSQTLKHDSPFIKKGSIDEGSQSAYKTVLDIAIQEASDEENWAESDAYRQEEGSSEEAVFIESDYDEDHDENYDYKNYDADEYEDSNVYESDNPYDEYEEDTSYQQLIDTLYEWYNRTPAQIEATNYYFNQNMSLNKISEFDPVNKKLSMVYSYDFASPTTYYSIQLPLALDFNRSELTLDPSALLPLVAIISPEHAPLPEELEATTVAFKLPQDIIDQVPPSVIYDAFISAIGYSLSELETANFTALDISKDAYAKKVGAHSAVKLNLDSKQTGKLLGVTLKHMSDTLQDYVDLRPDLYPNSNFIKVALENWQQTNKKFQSGDLGSLFQLIEAVAPLSFNQSNYYYFDSRGKLIASQSSLLTGGDFMGATTTLLSQTRYDERGFKSHPLSELYQQSFGQPFSKQSPASVDGNAWIKKIQDRKDKLNQAYAARSDYDSEDALLGNESLNSIEDEAYQPSIRIIDYGNVNDYEKEDDYEQKHEQQYEQ